MNEARSTSGETQAEVIADLRSRIRERWEGFSPAARAVCRSLAERSAEELLFLSAVELGAEAKTSNATVVRTVQALGYSGLAELKARIAAPFTRSTRPEFRARKRVESSCCVGRTPGRYLTTLRISRAEDALTRTTAPLSVIARNVGYGNEFAFATAFRRHHGTSPGQWRRRVTSAG